MTPSLEDLRARIEAALAARTGGSVTVHALAPLHGGACQENFLVDLECSAGERPGRHRLVLRSDARTALAGSLGRCEEFEVARAAAEAGVQTPAAHWLTADLVRPGAWAYFLDWAAGEAIGRRVVRNADLAPARALLPTQLATQLARIHALTPATHPHLPLPGAGAPGADPVAVALAEARAAVAALPEPHPALELALSWLEAHRPAEREVTLVHGDFRTGNFLVTPSGLSAVLDWEFARWGSPFEDLGWLCVRDWRFGQLDLPVGGFARRAPFYAAYAEASGRAVDPRTVHFWEVLGNVRWATGSVQQGERYLSGEESDLELIAIARRAVEMEFEALRLIEQSEKGG
jgi:aminoglycoside phosphotransferase (APT) family kinase protein